MLGRVISTARKQKNLSQKELGDLLNISNKAVSKWENGETTPRSETLIKL
ncbi:MAG: helix-turn-helix domain-containing protein [Eubacterium sp.]